MRETQVQSLGGEDPLEKEMATHSNTTAWKIPWMEEPGGLQSMGLQRVRDNWATSLHFTTELHDQHWLSLPVGNPGYRETCDVRANHKLKVDFWSVGPLTFVLFRDWL